LFLIHDICLIFKRGKREQIQQRELIKLLNFEKTKHLKNTLDIRNGTNKSKKLELKQPFAGTKGSKLNDSLVKM